MACFVARQFQTHFSQRHGSEQFLLARRGLSHRTVRRRSAGLRCGLPGLGRSPADDASLMRRTDSVSIRSGYYGPMPVRSIVCTDQIGVEWSCYSRAGHRHRALTEPIRCRSRSMRPSSDTWSRSRWVPPRSRRGPSTGRTKVSRSVRLIHRDGPAAAGRVWSAAAERGEHSQDPERLQTVDQTSSDILTHAEAASYLLLTASPWPGAGPASSNQREDTAMTWRLLGGGLSATSHAP